MWVFKFSLSIFVNSFKTNIKFLYLYDYLKRAIFLWEFLNLVSYYLKTNLKFILLYDYTERANFL